MPTTTRRSQAERRTATVSALLDATLQSLVEVGIAATTTRGVAQRAGVSQGAQQHYFPTKALLVDATIIQVMDQFVADLRAASITGGTERERLHRLLDALWQAHQRPVIAVVHEVFTLARTDPETARLLAATLTTVHEDIVALANELLPSYAMGVDLRGAVLMTLAAVRATAQVAAIPGTAAAAPAWPALRTALARAFVPEGPEGPEDPEGWEGPESSETAG
ncbi:TetR family transcriptional regulator [Actinoplanes sp. NPDC051861]|uniref:TetR/AcrR family transcriptional regulator n=1 Tax=Actinoplanes sp. NPDC051861 TaxID=3155170 RepID=UPI00342799FA